MSNFEYREPQVRTVAKILEGMKTSNNIILNGPTGCGKSGIAYLLHEKMKEYNSGHKTTIICNQKLLQDQYADFLDNKDGEVMVIKGKSNYVCFADDKTSVDQAPCQHGIQCKDQAFCEYWQRRLKMRQIPLLIVNYHMVLSLMDSASGWSRESDLCIYDESHSLADIITDYYKVTATNIEVPYYAKISKMLEEKYSFKQISEDLDDVMHYLSSFKFDPPNQTMESLYIARMNLISDLSNLFTQMSPELMNNKSLRSVLSNLLSKEDLFCIKCRNWYRYRDQVRFVPDLNKDGDEVTYSLTPLTVDTVVEPVLKALSPKRMFMSATIFPRVFTKYIGLDEHYYYLQLPNSIPIDNRMIYIAPVAYFNKSNLQEKAPEFIDLIDTILSLLKAHGEDGDSGVIFTPSYQLSSALRRGLEAKASKMGYKLLVNMSSDGRDAVVEKFRDTNIKRRLLISPSFFEGINFEDDISRFQIVVKAPFKSMADKYVKEKMNYDSEWYEMDCLIRVIQSLGRSCRHTDDFCISYILDGNVLRLYKKYNKDIHKWFKDAVRIQD